MLEKINYYEDKIIKSSNKNEIKLIVREMFYDSVIDEDNITFDELIYQDVIPKLEQLGVIFDRENEIDYERVIKEEY